MAEPSADARIRDLERRLDLDPSSRLFVSLAEEYRKLGRLKDALSSLQKGLLAHPGYVAAQVAQGRVYLELGQATEAIATFTKVLVADPGNLVAAKSLADIQLSRGDKLEAVKKYKLYRALSGDRKADEIIFKLESEVAPRPVTPPRVRPEPPPPPPSFQETDKSRRRKMPPMPAAAPSNLSDAFEITSVVFDPGEDSGKSRAEDPFPFFPTRDVSLEQPPAASAPEARLIPVAGADSAPVSPAVPPPVEPEPAKPTGRALADLYYSQGHYGEALQIYDDLVTRHPFDEDLKRMRRDAEARLLPAGASTVAAVPDQSPARRLARIAVLKDWLSRVQAG